MKKIVVALSLLALTGTAMAQHYHHGHGFRHHGPRVIYRDNWIAPAVGAFIIGAAINEAHNRNQQPQVVIQNSQPVLGQVCTPWTETQNADGSMTRTRTCNQ